MGTSSWVSVASIQRHLADAVPSGDIHGAEQRDRDQQRSDEQGGDTIEAGRPARRAGERRGGVCRVLAVVPAAAAAVAAAATAAGLGT